MEERASAGGPRPSGGNATTSSKFMRLSESECLVCGVKTRLVITGLEAAQRGLRPRCADTFLATSTLHFLAASARRHSYRAWREEC